MPNPYASRQTGSWQGPPEGALIGTVAPDPMGVTSDVGYTLDSVPATAAEVVAWIAGAGSEADAIERAEAANEVNEARAKPWKSVSEAVEQILG